MSPKKSLKEFQVCRRIERDFSVWFSGEFRPRFRSLSDTEWKDVNNFPQNHPYDVTIESLSLQFYWKRYWKSSRRERKNFSLEGFYLRVKKVSQVWSVGFLQEFAILGPVCWSIWCFIVWEPIKTLKNDF